MNKPLNKTVSRFFMPAKTPFSPQQFADHQAEQKHFREEWLIKRTQEVNEILYNLAGGKTQTSMLNQRNELDPDYIDYIVNRSDRPEYKHINKDTILIFIDLGTWLVRDDNLLSDFAQLFIDAGWGPNTSAHIRAGYEYDVWLALEPVVESDGDADLDDGDFDDDEEEDE